MTTVLDDLLIECTMTDAVPEWTDGKPWDGHSWLCVLKNGRRRMSVPFFQGSAHTAEPTVRDVLSCLVSDADGVVGRSFAEWCSDYGYDCDSRKAERTYLACIRTSNQLDRFLPEWRDLETLR